MKIILLAAGGRAGSDFFHSLLDGHPEILQFPGYLRVDDKINIILNANKLLDVANLFVKFYPEFFDSKKINLSGGINWENEKTNVLK